MMRTFMAEMIATIARDSLYIFAQREKIKRQEMDYKNFFIFFTYLTRTVHCTSTRIYMENLQSIF